MADEDPAALAVTDGCVDRERANVAKR